MTRYAGEGWWPFRKRRLVGLEHRHEVAQAGHLVYLTLAVGYEDVPQALTSSTVAMTHETAAQLHRDLSKAAERARLHRG